MEVREALVFPGGCPELWTTVDSPVVQANRMRTRERACTLMELGAEVSGGPPVEVAILDRRGDALAVRSIPCAEAGFVWRDVPPVRLPPETTCYLATHLLPSHRFRVHASLPSAHPAFVDLGTWHSPGALDGPKRWCPSQGLRAFAASFRFCAGKADVASARQREILDLAAEGRTDKEIARRLGVSPDTVDFHWRRVRARYGASSRTEAVAAYLREASERLREDLEAERDRWAAQAWLARAASGGDSPTRMGTMRSWPLR